MGHPIGIEVQCPNCSDVRVVPEAVTVRVCIDDVSWSYWFVCPQCARRAARPTAQGPALEAIAAGSPFESWHLPAEMSERHEGPTFELRDLLELRLELTAPNWFEVLSEWN